MRFKEKNKRNKDLKFMGKIAQKPGGGASLTGHQAFYESRKLKHVQEFKKSQVSRPGFSLHK
jgi:hypothetical protein